MARVRRNIAGRAHHSSHIAERSWGGAEHAYDDPEYARHEHGEEDAGEAEEGDGAERQEAGQRAWRNDSRRLRNGLIGLAILTAFVAALVIGVPGLRADAKRIVSHADLGWVGAGVALELLCCGSYVVLFERVFWRLRRRLASRLSLSELAMNSLVSAGGLGGFALGAWVLRTGGAPLKRIAERSMVMFLLTSAVNVSAVVVVGVLMGAGVIAGSTNPLLTFLPAGAAAAAIVGTLLVARWAGRKAGDVDEERHRWAIALSALSEAVSDAIGMLREPDWRVLGAVGYWMFDNAVLLVAFYAYERTPAVGAVILGYLVGMLANSLPIPGGFGAVEGGIAGMLLLYGERPASTVVAAVLTYRVISLWVPSVIGTIAFWGVHRELGQPLMRQPESVSEPS